jgi:predicted RNA binding protein YcfA (HicA-like mRNA interferase family)
VGLPRDLNGRELAALLHRHYGYEVVRQTGSYLRLTTTVKGEHRVTVPAGGPLRVGTLAAASGAVIVDYFLDYKSGLLPVTGRDSVNGAPFVSPLCVTTQHGLDGPERIRKPTLYPLGYEGRAFELLL